MGEEVRLARLSEAIVPDNSLSGQSLVEPGRERALTEQLKQFFLAIDSDPESAQAYLHAKFAKRAKLN